MLKALERYWNGSNKLAFSAMLLALLYSGVYWLFFVSHTYLFGFAAVIVLAILIGFSFVFEIMFNNYQKDDHKVYTVIPIIFAVLLALPTIGHGFKNADKLTYRDYRKNHFPAPEHIKADGKLSNFEYAYANFEEWNDKRIEEAEAKEREESYKEYELKKKEALAEEQRQAKREQQKLREIADYKERDRLQKELMEDSESYYDTLREIQQKFNG